MDAFSYSMGIMLILLTHEMGHYLMARLHRVPASLPYFIPIPFQPFGTLGAVIKMEGRMPNRRALFDIGLAGPLAGLVMIIPITLIGLNLSDVRPIDLDEGTISLGESLLFRFLGWLIKGSLKEGTDIVLHPLAYAGWVGLLVTSINLLPIGQLDGGHVVYAMFRDKSKIPANIFYVLFIFVFLFYYVGWVLLVVLLALFRHHPATLDDSIPIDKRRRILGYLALIVFIVTFTPVPFHIGDGLIPMLIRQLAP
jgi:membrane-associated protease RseP (regulator of RpoE activity)